MQTFVPYADLRASCQVLDGPRLGKQRVETFQILRALTWPSYAWKNHPAVRMWRGFIPALVLYGVENCREWTRRGNADSVLPQLLGWSGGEVPEDPAMPPWWGREDLHLSHRARLVQKDPEFYRPLFGDLPDLPYLWPPDVFPRWPLRRAGRELEVEDALALLGHEEPRDGQREAAEAVAQGRDCVLVAAPGTGGTTAGLLAGLTTPGQTVWVRGDAYPDPAPVPPVALVPPRVVEPADPSSSEDRSAAEPDAARPAAAVPAEAAAVDSAADDATGTGAAADRADTDDGTDTTDTTDTDGADTDDARRAPALARPPAAADLAAMQAETLPPEWLFTRPDRLPATLAGADAGLLVLEGDAAADTARLPDDRPPVLVVVPRADSVRRAELTARLGLRDPEVAGGGWDPATTWLDTRTPATAAERRRLLPALVRGSGGTLVVVADRARADRLVGQLVGEGLRAALWAEGIRPSRATAAVGAWRSRRLDALVVPAGALPPLGRAQVRALLAVDAVADREAWRDLVAAVAPVRATLVAGPDASEDALAYARTDGCRRAALLARLGQPVQVPCGRCSVCAPEGPAPSGPRRAAEPYPEDAVSAAGAGRAPARPPAPSSPAG